MLPRSSADILAKATTKTKRKRPTASAHRGQRLLFSPLSGAGTSSATTDEHFTFGNPEPERHRFNFHFKASKFSASAPEAPATCDDGVQRNLGTVEGAEFVGGEFSGPEELKSALLYSVRIIPNVIYFSPSTSPLSVTKAEAPPRIRMPRSERVEKVLALLKENRMSPFDLLIDILNEFKPEYFAYRSELYKGSNHKLDTILDHIAGAEAGKRKLWAWMRPHALQLVREIMGEEMDTVNKSSIVPGIASITPEFIETWTVDSSQQQAPVLMDILFTAAQTSLAAEKNKNKCPDATCNTIVKQLSYQRSNRSLGFPTVFGLFLWTSGCSRQTIDSLHRCGLSVCYSSVLKSVETLADQCMQLAIRIGTGLHVFCYDNINISTSIHVEQRGSSGPAKVTSGTFGVVYKVRNGQLEDMKLAPILERFKKVEGLDFNRDIRPSAAQLKSFQTQLRVVIVQVLTTYCPEFKDYSQVATLQHTPRRRMPAGYKTEQFPIRITTIEEATVRGNLLYHDDVYMNQLNRPLKDLCEYAIPTFNDQLTASRIRSGQIMRARDINAWTRREVLVLGFGLFHLCLNFIWALLHIHRGSLTDVGSLAYFFVVMEKTRLSGEHPDYHTLLSALTQIADGVILNAWRHETGYHDLAKFAAILDDNLYIGDIQTLRTP